LILCGFIAEENPTEVFFVFAITYYHSDLKKNSSPILKVMYVASFLPCRKNLPFWRNSTFRYVFEWRDETLVEGKPVIKPHDLTGYTGLALITPLPGEPGTPLELTTENGGVIFGGYQLHEPKNGLIELYINKEQIEAVTFKKANYTLYATEPSGPKDDYPLLSGRFVMSGPPL
jgi:hypothetical protein